MRIEREAGARAPSGACRTHGTGSARVGRAARAASVARVARPREDASRDRRARPEGMEA